MSSPIKTTLESKPPVISVRVGQPLLVKTGVPVVKVTVVEVI